MTTALHSFGWLLRHHPDAHASILADHGGDRAAAADNWQDLQQQIHERGAQTAVKAERVRCLDLMLDAQERGLPADRVIAAIEGGNHGLELPAFERLRVLLPTVSSSLAQSIVARALYSGA